MTLHLTDALLRHQLLVPKQVIDVSVVFNPGVFPHQLTLLLLQLLVVVLQGLVVAREECVRHPCCLTLLNRLADVVLPFLVVFGLPFDLLVSALELQAHVKDLHFLLPGRDELDFVDSFWEQVLQVLKVLVCKTEFHLSLVFVFALTGFLAVGRVVDLVLEVLEVLVGLEFSPGRAHSIVSVIAVVHSEGCRGLWLLYHRPFSACLLVDLQVPPHD